MLANYGAKIWQLFLKNPPHLMFLITNRCIGNVTVLTELLVFRMRKFLGHPDPLVRGPDPSIIKNDVNVRYLQKFENNYLTLAS